MKRGRIPLGIFCLVLTTASGCSAILGIHDAEIESGSEAGSGDGSIGPGDASVVDVKTDSSADSSLVIDTDADGATTTTSVMITAPNPSGGGTFEIDVNEVTQRQYADFLAKGSKTTQPAECVGNTTFTPKSGFTPNATPNYPVVGVDWCDAFAYCKWAGKRLCGGVGGAPGTYANTTQPAQNEWLWACTKGNTQTFPYGNTENPTACNIQNAVAGTPEPVKSRATCTGGYDGLYDMVGNSTEWQNHCDDAGCAILGGSYTFPGTGSVACATFTGTQREGQFGDLSFRCCR